MHLKGQNVGVLRSLAQPATRVNNVVKKSNLSNILMQLRKYVPHRHLNASLLTLRFIRCLQHPYLVSRDLEPAGPDLTQAEVHQNLLAASAKLKLLHVMLPKLKAKGHRVLLFSQVLHQLAFSCAATN